MAVAKARVLGIERRGIFVRRVVVRGEEDRSLLETTRRRIAVEDIATAIISGLGEGEKAERNAFSNFVLSWVSAITNLYSIKNSFTR